MNPCSMREARVAAGGGRAFCVRYEYVGGTSNKFWCYEREQDGGPTHVRFGRRGTYGQCRNSGISWYDAVDRAEKKLRKGYELASCHCSPAPQATSLPLISESLPAPFNGIRSIVGGSAFDGKGNLIAHLPPETAADLTNQYQLA